MDGHDGSNGKTGSLVLRIVALEPKAVHAIALNHQHLMTRMSALWMDHQKMTIRIAKVLVRTNKVV